MENQFDYIAETNVTASGMFAPENANIDGFALALNKFIAAANELDKYKKVLFRGRTPDEANVAAPLSKDDSLEAFLPATPDIGNYIHCAVGLATEAGELLEPLASMIEDGRAVDVVNVREELGDCLWYMARGMVFAETNFDEEMRRNIAKLRNRHGADGFNKERDENRNLFAEREILEKR